MTQPRLIRKYVNRRLYDTAESRYVNLEDLRRLIIDGQTIRVVERASGEDISTAVLLQIIAETERGAASIFEPGFLCDLIRLSGSGQEQGIAEHLQAALQDVLVRNAGRPVAATRPAGHGLGGASM